MKLQIFTLLSHITLYVLFPFIHSQEQKEIRFAFEIFRHGARSPYNNLNSTFHDWFGFQWEGTKELTSVGLRQHYLIGYSNRIRYINQTNLLSSSYDPREIFIISTDSNRTILSANAQLQGLYPPGTGPTLTPTQQDNAVPPNNMTNFDEAKTELGELALPNQTTIAPVHSFFTGDHYIQLQDKKVCPAFKTYYNNIRTTGNFTKFLNYLESKYGKNITSIAPSFKEGMFSKYENAYSILDDIIASSVDGRDLSFLDNVTNSNITKEEMIKDAYDFFLLDFNMTQQDRNLIGLIAMSPIFNQIQEWMNKKISLDKQNDINYKEFDMPRFVMYSAHDTTVAAFEYFMEAVFNCRINYPYFASHANLELVKYGTNVGSDIKDSDYFVEFFFDDEYITSINYVDFINQLTLKSKTMNDIEEFCNFPKEDDSYIYLIVIAIVFILMDILFIGGIIYIWLTKCRYTSKKELLVL